MESDHQSRDEGGLGNLEIPFIGDLSMVVGSSFGVFVSVGGNK